MPKTYFFFSYLFGEGGGAICGIIIDTIARLANNM